MNIENWKNLIPYKNYGNDYIHLEKVIPINIIVKGVNQKSSDINSLNLYVKNTDLDKNFNKLLSIHSIKNGQVFIKELNKYFSPKDWILECQFNNETIGLSDLLNEFRIKNASNELDVLYFTKMKNGKYLAETVIFKDICNYYFQNEDTFNKLNSLISNKQYSLPDNKEDLKEMSDYLKSQNQKNTESVILNLMDSMFHEKDRVFKQKLKLKV